MITAEVLDMYSDASGKIGFGATCGPSWMYGLWDEELLEHEPNIEYLELYGLTTGFLQWGSRFKNRKICLFCDNISVVHMVKQYVIQVQTLHGAVMYISFFTH